MRNLFFTLSLFSAIFSPALARRATEKIYGVNLGSWLLLEAWMLPQEWLDMGGQDCADCSACIMTEHSFAKAYPDTVDATFAKHWETWFTQDHVQQFKEDGINTVRLPLGYWIVEALVDRPTESYPRGGLTYLRRGLSWLQDAGIQVILDHHALPGVQVAGQEFTGNCTNDPQFYTPYNYHRALVWTAVMTALTHLDPTFGSVFAIEAINEPIMDASKTPGYGDFQKNFVQTVRAVELVLGISVPHMSLGLSPSTSTSNFTAALGTASTASLFNPEVRSVLKDAIPILLDIGKDCGIEVALTFAPFKTSRSPIMTNFMDINWQYNNPSNPADAAIGSQGYDNHLYYSYGGVADANPTAYLTSVCNLQRIQNDAAVGNSPLWFGEWGLPTQFNATDEFLYKWADAQKLAYSQGAGWIFWNFKTEISSLTHGNALARQWSYLEGRNLGFLTKDPAALHDPNVCVPYIYNNTATSATPSPTA
ncbi:glycoside hydrolase family 5 protein [Paxillus rubicundulus Ve08.2h10]|uniref:Glycoside hydrolase family 5 protein n=1 Tax=Paxillus rubicundulus Ve08.2h10 TaxID=930991 RepID=A0A0D0ECC7_9AGAM|nr:glycoside hydrolase family 5 protein [Paxillus rubicundulus Ve08.2h10]